MPVSSTLDATTGFWALKFGEELSKLTTFQTPFGRYRFLRTPFGIKSIPEIYQHVMTKMLQCTHVIVDDRLVWAVNMEQHDERLKQVLDRVKQNNLKLNPYNFQLRKEVHRTQDL